MPDLPRKSLNFNKSNRLVSKKDFQSVFASPHKLSRPSLRFIFLTNQRLTARLGIVIGKHQVKRAVDRNRLRRVARESFRHYQQQLVGLDIVLIMQAGCLSLSKKALRERIDQSWLNLILPAS